MARYGFIHDKLDIKFLILYLMARVAAPVDFAMLTDLAMCDAGVDYFEFAEAVSEMVETGHLVLEGDRYAITGKGRRDGAACESSLPYSVKRRCGAALAKVNSALRRDAQVRASITPHPSGSGFLADLALDDENGGLFTLSLFCPTQEQAGRVCAGFKARPERIYNEVLEALLAQDEDG